MKLSININELTEIDKLEFGIMSNEEILQASCVHVTSSKYSGDNLENTVYDERMGSITQNKICVTCKKDHLSCTGHFGHIDLIEPILHPLHYKFILDMLRVVCNKCSKIVFDEDNIELRNFYKYNGYDRFKKIIHSTLKINICVHCLEKQPKIQVNTLDNNFYMYHNSKDTKESRIYLAADEIYRIFNNIPDKSVVNLGFDPKLMHPRNLVIKAFPVLPPHDRPPVNAENLTCDDDLTLQYIEIIKINKNIQSPKMSENDRRGSIQALKFKIKSIMDNGHNKARHTNGRPYKCLKKRIAGKEGQVRGNLMGKRVEQAARSVIGPGPSLRIGELAIPKCVAEILSVKERVNTINIKFLQKLVDSEKCNSVTNGTSRHNLKFATKTIGTRIEDGDIIQRKNTEMKVTRYFTPEKHDKLFRKGEEIELVLSQKKKFIIKVGDEVERQLMDGDVVLFNRQPTLHKTSIIQHKIIIRPGKTFRFNLASTATYNADFDGDEMNLHAAQSIESRSEIKELSSPSTLLISAQSSTCTAKIVQDSLLASFLLTKENESIPKDRYWNICSKGVNVDGTKWSIDSIINRISRNNKIYRKYKGEDLAFTGKGLFSMVLPEDFFYENKNSAYSKEPVVIIKEGVLLEGAINKKDLGGGHTSITRLLAKEYNNKIACTFLDNLQFIVNEWFLHRGFSIGIKDCLIDKNKDDIENSIAKCFLEAKIIEENTTHSHIKEAKINEALGKARNIGMKLSKESFGEDNGFIATVTSGSKGDYFNIAQISGFMGQQNFSGKRIQNYINKGQRTMVHYPFKDKLTKKMEYQSKGFVSSSFIKGLEPEENWNHAITGREGVTDTATKTSLSGYIQRKCMKVGEDAYVNYNGCVVNANYSIIQFVYGDDGLDGSETIIIDNKPHILNIKRTVNRFNYLFEKRIKIRNKFSKLINKMNIKLDDEITREDAEISDNDDTESKNDDEDEDEDTDDEDAEDSCDDDDDEDDDDDDDTDDDDEEDDDDDEINSDNDDIYDYI
jgi:DNA-directed RNA polymerase beta' subunit